MRFNRLKALSTDQAEILRALSKSGNDLIEVEDNGWPVDFVLRTLR